MRDPSLDPDEFYSARDEIELECEDEFDEYGQEELEDEFEEEDEWEDEFDDEDYEDDDVAIRKRKRREDWD
jgi:hypothetical protein